MTTFYEYLAETDPELSAELLKAIKKPDAAAASKNPPSIPGAPAPGNTAGPGRPKGDPSKTTVKPEAKTTVSDTVKTNVVGEAKTIVKVPKSVGSTQEIVYLPKKDFPKSPAGTIGSTENSWKVPAGIGRQLQAQQEMGNQEQALMPTTPQEASLFNKKPNPRDVVKDHLQNGTIAVKKNLDGDNASETFKVVIQGNGAGIMKPQIDKLTVIKTEVSDEKPEGPGWTFDGTNEKWTRKYKEDYDLYSKSASGTFGAGNITPRKNVQREVAAHHVAAMHGLDLVPVTVSRSEQGKEHSVQQWKDGYTDLHTLRGQGKIDPEASLQNDFEVLKTMVPKAKHAELEEKLMDAAVLDIVINNNDRHGANFVVNPETGDLSLIDHGFAFCNSMNGVRNHFLHNTFHGNKPIKMSKRQMTNLENKGLGDYKRAMAGMQDWEVGQTFLRNRYVVWLQKNHGTIDRQKFLHTMNNNQGTVGEPGENWDFAGASDMDKWREYADREQAGMLPHQLFESWSKAYIQQASSDPSHKDHHDARALDHTGVFMQAGFPSHEGGVKGYRDSGKHRKYEKSITASFDIPRSIIYHMNSSRAKRDMQTRDSLEQLNADQRRKMELAGTKVADSNETVSTKVEKSGARR